MFEAAIIKNKLSKKLISELFGTLYSLWMSLKLILFLNNFIKLLISFTFNIEYKTLIFASRTA